MRAGRSGGLGAGGGGEGDDVFTVDDAGGVAAEGEMDHGEAEFAKGDEAVGEQGATYWIEPTDKPVNGMSMQEAGRGPDEAGTKGIDTRKGELHEVVLGLAFDAGPAAAAFFGTVGAGARYIGKDHAWI